MPADKVLSTFGSLMGLVEVCNGLGISLSCNVKLGSTIISLGNYLVVAAVCIQIIVIIIFVVLAGTFVLRIRKASLSAPNVKTMTLTLYASMALICVRSLYRLVEHVGNSTLNIVNLDALRALSPVYRYEAFFYVFEASVMLVNSALWNIWNPGRFLPSNHRIYLTRDRGEVEGPRDPDSRSVLEMTLCLLTFGLLFRRKKTNYANQEVSESQSRANTCEKDSA